MELLFWIFLICVLVFFFVPSVRLWLLSRLVARLQRKMQSQFEEQMRRSQGAQSARREQRQGSSPREKLDIDSIEAKRFDKENSNDYVDFEELP